MFQPTSSPAVCASRVLLAGNVQGIGYRPALARLAQSCGLSGWVRNTLAGVEVHVEGTLEALAHFMQNCQAACPERGSVTCMHVQSVALERSEDFTIRSAQSDEPIATAVPRDIVVCDECLADVTSAGNRRHGYELTSCCNCGPRYSILDCMPYERDNTALVDFPLCRACRHEYQSPTDRRFHAQSIACADCGPRLTGTEAALECLARGDVLAIKGIGGYQLLVDARNPRAIDKLRQRKQRPSKPLAIMVGDCAIAQQIAEFGAVESEALSSPQGPIVVLRLRAGALPETLAPNLQTIGVMLPTSPLHAWLARAHGPLVVSSGNIEGQPLAFQPAAAHCELASVADHFIDHNRPILCPIDDSVTRIIANRSVTLRLARGFAPLPLRITRGSTAVHRLPHVLALGGHQKVAIALCNGRQAVLGQHIGDLDTLETRARFVQHVSHMLKLYGVRPDAVVHDAHCDYFTSQWAGEYCRDTGARPIAVQHHHAHIVAGMVQAGLLGKTGPAAKVLGIAWDGSGLGSDGTLWGGEFLIATAVGFERTGCLRPLKLPGGEAAIRQPWRIAAAMLTTLRHWDPSLTHRLPGQALIDSISDSQFSPQSTSIGRLFDAIAALVLPQSAIGLGNIGYEGHFAAMLEDLCNPDAQGSYPFPIQKRQRSEESRTTAHSSAAEHWLDWRPLMRGILHDLDSEVPRADIAMRFHRSLAEAIKQISDLHPDLPIVLGGGVFQNKILVELVQRVLAERMLVLPGEIPAGDGGLAAGQLAIACAQLELEQCA